MLKEPNSWSADGKTLVFDQSDAKTAWQLYLLPVDGEHKPVPYLRTPMVEIRGVGIKVGNRILVAGVEIYL